MAPVKMLAHRLTVTAACLGLVAGTLLVAQDAASAAADLGSMAVRR